VFSIISEEQDRHQLTLLLDVGFESILILDLDCLLCDSSCQLGAGVTDCVLAEAKSREQCLLEVVTLMSGASSSEADTCSGNHLLELLHLVEDEEVGLVNNDYLVFCSLKVKL
jgi:hypothetical protein